MRRLLILIAACMTFGPSAVAAQDATPTAVEPGANVAANRTDTRYVVPFTPDGLNPGLNVTSRTEGICTFGSSIAHSRPDA
ncbi:MAG TPA: hypothetical protein VK356_10300, partial [Thermomicrobiales bacterium]|nr:hypothetical protein [Thermomicrobiales bacterium]